MKTKVSQETEVRVEQGKKSDKITWKEMIVCILIALVCSFGIHNYLGRIVIVKGESMQNTLNNKDRLIAEKITTNFGEIERFDIVIFDPHNDVDKYWIKRVIGLPGETVQIIGQDIYINGERLDEDYGKEPIKDAGFVVTPYTLQEDEYFVLGDNRCNSTDGRWIGPVKLKDIDGRACYRLWPFDDFGTIE